MSKQLPARPTVHLRHLLSRLLIALAVTTACALGSASPAAAVEPGLVIGPRPTGENVDQVNRAADAGAGWIRIFVDWSTAEPTDGGIDPFYLREFNGRVDAARARGMKVLMVVTNSPSWASGSTQPTAPPTAARVGKFGEFMRQMASAFDGRVSAWEVWNEPDAEASFAGGPNPALYAAMLKSAYTNVKSVDPDVTVVLGGLVGNDHAFLEQLYAQGAKGSFDAVGVHTDTACLTSDPGDQYREPDGRIGRFSFTGYREVRHTMMTRGDDKPIWMTELGWSTLTATCQVGDRAGTKVSGVDEATQAAYLSKAYACLQSDPYVQVAMWFSVQDVLPDGRYDHWLGLLRHDGSPKPALDAFRAFATAPAKPSVACGSVYVDSEAPKVTFASPTADLQYVSQLPVRASATDNTGVASMTLYVDGSKVGGQVKGSVYNLDWNGAKNLPLGTHTLTMRAIDNARNVGETSVVVRRVTADQLSALTATFRFSAKRLSKGRVRLRGGVSAPAGSLLRPRGKVQMVMQVLSTRKVRSGGRTVTRKVWKSFSRYGKGVARPFDFTVTVRRPGRWRVYATYDGEAPFRTLKTGITSLGMVR